MCKYCDLDNYKHSTLKETKYISIGICHNDTNDYELLIDSDLDGEESLKINYCPMCGRKLVD